MNKFIKKALIKAKSHVRNDLSVHSTNDEYLIHVLVMFNGRQGYVVNIDDDGLTADFGSPEESELMNINYSLLSNRDFIISYRNLYESFNYGNLASYYLFHKKIIIRTRRFIRKIKDNILRTLSIKEADLYKVVEKLVKNAARTDFRKPYIDENDLITIFNPFVNVLNKDITHDDYQPAKGYYRLLLNALVESGDIEPEGMGYVIKPKIFLTHNKMESERKKHIQIILVTAIAAGASVIAAIPHVIALLS
ncbi:hypothetical protein VXS05_15730 [Photobacterium toruni]|uniref:hypothetical protein n=1 Tax=Photobacterium toruni TaxID=1935446 RepID=UPI002E17633D|nr:hypothetical protein [Photobacterium toruni]